MTVRYTSADAIRRHLRAIVNQQAARWMIASVFLTACGEFVSPEQGEVSTFKALPSHEAELCAGCLVGPKTLSHSRNASTYSFFPSGDPAAKYTLEVVGTVSGDVRIGIFVDGRPKLQPSTLIPRPAALVLRDLTLGQRSKITVRLTGPGAARLSLRVYPREIGDTPVVTLTGQVAESHFGPGGAALFGAHNGASRVNNGHVTVNSSAVGAQLFFVFDALEQVRGLTIAIPGGAGGARLLPADAGSTATALLLLTPGIASASLTEIEGIVATLHSLNCFPATEQLLRSLLPVYPLRDVVQQQLVRSQLEDCVREYLLRVPPAHSKLQLAPTHNVQALGSSPYQTSSGAFTITRSTGVNPVQVTLANAGWRYVSVWRYAPGVAPTQLKAAMSGAIPLSWGSMFAGTLGNPTVISDPAFAASGAGGADYWISGMGLAQSVDNPPADLPYPGQANLMTWIFNIGFPIIDIVFGLNASPQAAVACVQAVANPLISATQVASSLSAWSAAKTTPEILQTSVDLSVSVVTQLALIIENSGAALTVNCGHLTTSSMAGVALKAVTSGIGTFNFVMFGITLSQAAPVILLQVPSETEPPETGDMSVTITGLSTTLAASVLVTGPAGVSFNLTGSQNITGLTTGSYTIAAASITSPGEVCTPQPTTQVATVAPNFSLTVVVAYTCVSTFGSLTVTVAGLPSAISPAISVSGPGGFVQQVSGSVTLGHLVPGDYAVIASTVTGAGIVCVPTPLAQTIAIMAVATSAVTVSYGCASSQENALITATPSMVVAMANTMTLHPIVVRVTDVLGAPIANAAVTLEQTQAPIARLYDPDYPHPNPTVLDTDANGEVRIRLWFEQGVGTYSVEARYGSSKAVITATIGHLAPVQAPGRLYGFNASTIISTEPNGGSQRIEVDLSDSAIVSPGLLTVSPNGTKLAFTGYTPSSQYPNARLFMVELATREIQNIAATSNTCAPIAFTADGNQLLTACFNTTAYHTDIAVVDIAAGQSRTLASQVSNVISVLGWSLDQSSVFLVRRDQFSPNFTDSVWRLDVGSGNLSQVHSKIPAVGIAKLSPDQRTLAVVGPSQHLVLVDMMDGSFRQLDDFARLGFDLAWAPDGSALAFWGMGNGIAIVDLSSGQAVGVAWFGLNFVWGP